jgi:hypothetical protein
MRKNGLVLPRRKRETANIPGTHPSGSVDSPPQREKRVEACTPPEVIIVLKQQSGGREGNNSTGLASGGCK